MRRAIVAFGTILKQETLSGGFLPLFGIFSKMKVESGQPLVRDFDQRGYPIVPPSCLGTWKGMEVFTQTEVDIPESMRWEGPTSVIMAFFYRDTKRIVEAPNMKGART